MCTHTPRAALGAQGLPSLQLFPAFPLENQQKHKISPTRGRKGNTEGNKGFNTGGRRVCCELLLPKF